MQLTENEITVEYINRINNALEFIDENLDTNLTLESVSKKVYYSSFHFHRVFKMVTNETLNSYITRKNL